MKVFIRVLIFILAFQMEVRVRAGQGIVEQPQNCLVKKETCAVQAAGAPFHVVNDQQKIHAGSGSSLVRLGEEHWRFLTGKLWVEQGEKTRIETLYGNLQALRGEYWVIDQGEQILVRNVSADLSVSLRDGKTLRVPEGFEFWIGPINSLGKSEYGMLQPIDFESHLKEWNQLYLKDKESFKKEARILKEGWGDLTLKSSHIYQQTADRFVAMQEAQRTREDQRRAKVEAENQKIRALYRQKVFER